ncbi:MAG TPA: hypothetical protein VGQ95_06370 [Chthoniobacterales bacterium]|nr:hypothetical protein [Chthoniobacterales bacterium]
MSGRFLFVFSALLLFASVAFGAGDYQRTKDGKTTVWNAEPKPGDEATWFGDRDGEGYATGAGTLTWYTAKGNVYGRYFGNMVRGKFSGRVNVHSKGKTGHATFADGKRISRWAAGPAPSRPEADGPITRALPVESDSEQPSVPKTEKPKAHTEPSVPAAGPSVASSPRDESVRMADRTGEASAKTESVEPPTITNPARTEDTPVQRSASSAKATAASEVGDQKPEIADRPADGGTEKLPAADEPKADADNSLRLLAGPPSSLHMKPGNEGPPAGANPDAAAPSYTNARLTKEEVVDLADAEARSRGYDLTQYERMDPQYFPADEIWTLGYNGAMEMGKHFSVTIDDKTKGRVFVPGK